ncbi:hypothetical protein EDD30_3575 [Couchioplanes caeruleus]|uniref:Uncharacterized protein n=3 Tax=Couchioplanes caeruleus TaxID=56438 RepID=A0A3N1GKE7_9ACTN|nr:hypothetical protein EDD30_3575 [Couchioplanes caeruleus]
MAEPGWPLIPREVLPAPVQPARPRPRRAAAATPAGRQLSVFGVEAVDPSLADLAGLLAGPGRLGRMGGTARVSVRVDAAWRVHVLVGELVSRGLVVNWHPVPERLPEEPVVEEADASAEWHPVPERPSEEPVAEEADGSAEEMAGEEKARTVAFDVATAYSSRLNGLARSWPPPTTRIFLNGPRLRLWVAAAGAPRPQGYALGLDPDGSLDTAVHDALTRIGLGGTIQAGPAYVIAGRRRLARLAELIGERPAAAPERLWPGGAAA